ncbi:30S ribosomal protein S18 [Candidatus Acetothermia bacterium]|jgi:small subunit ribosomal protein S18|nr:30S ribosomal protein S18 [Candidatus Acetothermia bacterium]MCI2425938.1 30S ribosomal protein S18 [Candidatus Acetothermia bacterium]MCI2427554.1 30S ribosomal protein S18 [Candidatus Acetothermia bacterium]MCI2428401.1 30S ribosomal protein S18 [Candidatus Acetothermia bacterium]
MFRIFQQKRKCNVCERKLVLSYKKPELLKAYMNRHGKILSQKATALCARHQRAMTQEVGRARKMALLPYTSDHK